MKMQALETSFTSSHHLHVGLRSFGYILARFLGMLFVLFDRSQFAIFVSNFDFRGSVLLDYTCELISSIAPVSMGRTLGKTPRKSMGGGIFIAPVKTIPHL
jgi:hypothetical protein